MLSVVLVEGIEEGTVTQHTWPDHTGWPDNKLAQKPPQRETKKLGSKGKQDLEAHGGGLTIENMLCECDIIWVAPTIGGSDHDWNADMFFDWKGAWVEGPDITKCIEVFGGKDSCKSMS